MFTDEPPRRAAVLGKPVAHSLSPVLHDAAYRALGLSAWRYERVEVTEAELGGFVAGLDAAWAGLSVTMPGKRAALECADVATERARAIGAANTLVQVTPGKWRADSTDIDGVSGALREVAGSYGPVAGAPGVVLGAGGTAAAALGAFAELGLNRAWLVVREPERARQTVSCASGLGIDVDVFRWDDVDFAAVAEQSAVVVSTVPAAAVGPHARELATARYLLDVIYDPWPTPLAEAVFARGGSLGTGLHMLLHQAFGQVEQFTGAPAPRAAMRRALAAETGMSL